MIPLAIQEQGPKYSQWNLSGWLGLAIATSCLIFVTTIAAAPGIGIIIASAVRLRGGDLTPLNKKLYITSIAVGLLSIVACAVMWMFFISVHDDFTFFGSSGTTKL